MDPRLATSLLHVLSAIAVLARLLTLRIARKYAWFAAYLTAGILQNFAWLWPYGSAGYATFWRVSSPIMMAVQVLAILELWRLTMRGYPSVQTIYRLLVPLIVGSAALISLMVGVDVWKFSTFPTFWHALYIANRFLSLASGVTAGLLAWFMTAFPGEINDNLERHALLLCGSFSSLALGLWIILLTNNTTIGGAVSVGSAIAFNVVRVYVIDGDGERTPSVVPLRPVRLARIDARWSAALRALRDL